MVPTATSTDRRITTAGAAPDEVEEEAEVADEEDSSAG